MLLFKLFHVNDPQVRLSDPVPGEPGTLPVAVSAPNVTCQWSRRSHPKNTYRWCILFHNMVLCISLNWKIQEAKSSICFISSLTSKKCYQINEYRYKWEFKLLSHKDNCPSPRETATSLLLIWWPCVLPSHCSTFSVILTFKLEKHLLTRLPETPE